MEILVKNNKDIVCSSHKITFGLYDEPLEKWKVEDENGNLLYYLINDGYSLVKNVTLPNDYEDGKYFYTDGQFVKNPDYKKYVPMDDRVSDVETAVLLLDDYATELLYQICLLQIGIDDSEVEEESEVD